MAKQTEEQRDAPSYEAPALTVIGSAEELTQGPNGGPSADGLWPHHSSGG